MATLECSTQFTDDIKLNAEIVGSLATLPTLLTIVGNTIFFVTFIKTKSLHAPSNLMLTALCFADLLVGLVYQPIFIVYLFGIRYGYQTSFFIHAYDRFFYFLSSLSGAYSFVITIDRYIAICYPFWYRRHVTYKRYIVLTVSIICTLLVWGAISMASTYKKSYNINGSAAIFLGIFVTVLLAVILMYCRIYQVASRHANRVDNLSIGTFEGEENREAQNRNKERKRAYTVGIVLGIWIATSLPFVSKLIFTLTRDYCKDAAAILKFDFWAKFFTALSSFANPFVYCYRSKEIRTAALKIFWRKHGENTQNGN